jgi:aldehyde:ferredoxin oxidoreductase
VLCDFLPFDIPEMVEMLNTATGFEYNNESYLLSGERIWNIIRLFNVREGRSAEHDTLPKRFFDEAAPEGDPKGKKIDIKLFDKAKLEYYSLRGWDSNGIPSKNKLSQLGL